MGRLALAIAVALLILVLVTIALHPAAWAFAIGIYPTPAGTPWTYQLLSGFVPAMAILSLAGNVATLWRLNTCAARWCIRLVSHTVNGRGWCSHHWQDVKPDRTMMTVLDEILAALREQPPNRPG